MTDNEIKELLISKDLSAIENDIALACNTYINKDFIDLTISSLRREISNSEISLNHIHQLLISKRDPIIKFGIRLYNTQKDAPLQEEYPVGEEIPKSQRPKVIASLGIGVGFGIKYAIYLHFLETNPNGLLDYLKKERIPKAQKFCKTLERIYKS